MAGLVQVMPGIDGELSMARLPNGVANAQQLQVSPSFFDKSFTNSRIWAIFLFKRT
jgi:hypothetical protein